MKYKRQLMTTVFALAMLAGGPSVFAYGDSVPNGKVPQYENQMQMKSYLKQENDLSNNKKQLTKKHKKFKKSSHVF
ncbi:MAG: hypothetical protein NTW98_01985 [Candidatus Nomurabacteria bacterium]|nr:hypothetical protein [Candidatus Nomurabacteria bacterium]